MWYPSHHGPTGRRPKLGWRLQVVGAHLGRPTPDFLTWEQGEREAGQLGQSSEGAAGKGHQTEHQGHWWLEQHWVCQRPWPRWPL